MEENVLQENKIVDILKNARIEKKQIRQIEDIQTRFIAQNILINLLRDDIADLEKILVKRMFENSMLLSADHKKAEKLRSNIIKAEKKSGILKSKFDNFLSENLHSNKQ
jgi:hemerythrin superfamily protein